MVSSDYRRGNRKSDFDLILNHELQSNSSKMQPSTQYFIVSNECGQQAMTTDTYPDAFPIGVVGAIGQ